jgi:hypothetical protein
MFLMVREARLSWKELVSFVFVIGFGVESWTSARSWFVVGLELRLMRVGRACFCVSCFVMCIILDEDAVYFGK